MNILVTGVGAIVGYGIINCLRKIDYSIHIVGMDIYEDAYGQYLCDEFIHAIPARDEMYPQFLKKIIREKNIDLVFFGTEQEISRLIYEKEFLGEEYRKLVINNLVISELSDDKWKTYQFLINNNINAIPSYIKGDFDELVHLLGCPFLLKPRKSYASKGIEIISNKEEFEFYKKRVADQFMVQKIIGDSEHEYTVAVFGYGDGTCSNSITFRRKLSQEGATVKARVEHISEIDKQIEKIVKLLKPIGPTDFQFRYDGKEYMLLEINPRISSSTSIRAAFGFNEAEMSIDFFVNNKRRENLIIKDGYAVRYIADCVIVK